MPYKDKEVRKQKASENYKKNKDARSKYAQSFKARYSKYKSSAKVRGLDFDLSFKEFESFWQKDCSYCGSAIATIGLDRVDSSVGYKIDNLVSCCTTCNKMKLDLEEEEWLNKMFTILKYKGII